MEKRENNKMKIALRFFITAGLKSERKIYLPVSFGIPA